MSVSLFSVRFVPGDVTVTVAPGLTAHAVAARAGIALEQPCGGVGYCGKCRVRFLEGAPPPLASEQALISPREVEEGVRLACQCVLNGPAVVGIPERSALQRPHQILVDTLEAENDLKSPVVQKRWVELPSPTLQDAVSDLERLQRALGPMSVDIALLRDLPRRLRDWGFKGTATLSDGRLLDFEEGDATGRVYVAAFDIGTTTLAGVLLDATSGEVLARVTRMNPQTCFGDDVVSRVQRVRENAAALDELQASVADAVSEMIVELAGVVQIAPKEIYEIVFAGNTAMQEILARLRPDALGESPFAPVTRAGLALRAVDLGVHLHPNAGAWIFPVIGGFVGGDAVAGGAALRFDEMEGPVALIDIGTNGELLLKHEGRLSAASCAAGPAFEGARITHGMRAARGAIERVTIGDDVTLNVIGGGPAAGLCGSALIDAVAELLRAGVIIPEGLLLGPDELPEDLSPALRRRVRATEDGAEFILAFPEESVSAQPIVINQRDVRELQLATAAIQSALQILLRRFNLYPGDVRHYFIGGAFGNYLRIHNAQRIGLLPAEIPLDRLSFAGNTALLGAQAAALSRTARARAEALARDAEHIELSLDPEFHVAYVDAMRFPEGK